MKTLYPFFWSNTMKTFLTSTAAACLTLCIGVSAQGDAFATYTTVDVPGADHAYAYGIDGSNIVGVYHDHNYIYHGFSYDGTTYTTVDVPGASDTLAYGIDGGNIVGYYYDIIDDKYVSHGFIYDGTTYTTIDVPGAKSTYIHGIDGNNIVRRYVDGTDLSSGVSVQPNVPEPASLLLLSLAIGLVAKRRSGDEH